MTWYAVLHLLTPYIAWVGFVGAIMARWGLRRRRSHLLWPLRRACSLLIFLPVLLTICNILFWNDVITWEEHDILRRFLARSVESIVSWCLVLVILPVGPPHPHISQDPLTMERTPPQSDTPP